MSRKVGFASFCVGALVFLVAISPANAQTRPGLITRNIEEAKRVTLRGNLRQEAIRQNDRGPVPDNLLLEHMLLQLRRSPQQEQALQEFINELHTQGSPNFHRWISAQEFGTRFGLAQTDLNAIVQWLQSHGLQANTIYPSGMVIDFSGTARQVSQTFHTTIHHVAFKGERHIANMSDPQIPAALAPAIMGVVSLNDVKPVALHKMRKARTNYTFDSFGATYALVPPDLATIYNLNPLFGAGYAGQGQTIVLIEDTDVYSAADWTTFRSTFGLSGYSSGSFTTIHPGPSGGPNNCSNPGVIAPNDAEAILDAEWASAAAPGATLQMASCADTTTTFGGLIAIENLINGHGQAPAIMSISYGQCETENGATANAAYNSAYQQAVTEGVSIFVSAGDSGAAGCDNSVSAATHGVGVNAFASTPYNVAVGGTDFSDTYSGTNNLYWNSTNTSTFASALSYVPEIPWNDSCAGQLISNYEGYSTPYGSTGLCSSDIGGFLQTTAAGGGGPSGCATGTPLISGAVGGSCQGWPKPSWQSIRGNPNDGVRDTPDVSLFAADGLWSHYYVFCWSDIANGGAACTGAPSGWSGAGGTSFASPIMAGVQALINQKAGSRQGNPNPEYYHLAATEYASNGTSCYSSNGAGVSSACIFYDVTQGDIDVNCSGKFNCYQPSGTSGVLSTSNSAYNPAYGTTTGWDFATGIGSINAANLVNSWPNSTPAFLLSASPSSLSITRGASVTTAISVIQQNGFSGSVNLSVSGLPSGVTASFSTNPATTSSTLTLTATSTAATGAVALTVTGTSGSLTSSTSVALTVTVVGNFALSSSPSSLTIQQGAGGTGTITVAPLNGFNSSVSLSASGLPGGVSASFSPNPATSSSTMTLAASSTAATGTFPVTVTGMAGGLINSTTVSVTITPGPNFTLSASPSSLIFPQRSGGTSTITVAPLNGFNSSVSLSASGQPSGVTASFSTNPATTSSTLTLAASSTATTGTFSVVVTGTSGSLTHSTTLSLTVTAADNFTSGWLDSDMGSVGLAGSATFANGTFTVNGAGQQIWDTADSFNFAYQVLSGDGTIVARVVSFQGGNANSESAGVMIRETLTAGSTNAYAMYGGQTIYFNDRPSTGASTSSQTNSKTVKLPYWVKLVRSGSTFSSYASLDGVNWLQVGSSQTISMAQSVYVGLAVSSDTTSALATATFDNVSISTAAAPAPVISAVSATTGSVGTAVVISGSGFGASQSSSQVVLNGNPVTISSWSATSVTITIPAGTSSGPLAVLVAPSMNASNPVAFTVTSQPLPSGWLNQDVGQVGVAGSATYTNGTFTVNGSGQYIWYGADGFHFAYQTLSGDGSIVARVVSVQGGSSSESGVMIRETLTASSDMAYLAYSGSTDIYGVYRPTVGANVSYANTSAVTLPYWVKLVRSGSTFTSYASPDGVNWVQVGGSQTISMAQNVYIGLALSSDVNTSLATATFDNVSVNSTAAPAPLISSVSPASGSVGSQVIISGSGFGATQGNSIVTLNGTPVSINAWSDASISFTIPSGASSGPLVVSVASSMNDSNPVPFSVVAPLPTFTLSASPSSLTIPQGASGASTISVTPQNGFGSSVSLSASGLPAGVTASFSANPATASSTLTLTAGSTATPGTFSVTVTGASGTLSNSTTVSLTVSAAPNFTLSASPSSLSILQGASGTSTISVSAQNGFSSSVSLVASGLPTGVTGSFSSNPATSSSTLTLTASSAATTGTFSVVVTGTSGTLNSSTTVYVTVSAPPSFTFSASPSSLSIAQGASGASTISVTPQNGFTGSVSLSASGLPTGVTAGFSPNPAVGSSTLTLTASSTAITGTFSVTVTGTGSGLSNSSLIAVTVTAALNGNLPQSWSDGDVGTVGVAGSATFGNGAFTVNGAGQQIWATADSFNFAYQILSGDGTIVARVGSVQGTSSTEAGVMIRDTLTAGSDMAYVAHAGNGDIYWIYRTSVGASASAANTNAVTLPYWVKLVRSGSTFSSYASSDGLNWVPVGGSQTISMAQSVYIGLAVSSNATSSLATATFDNVSISTAATPPPVISTVSATTGTVGSAVVISGSGFGATQGNSALMLNGTALPTSSWSDSSISITIPSGATSGPLAVLVAPSMNASNPVAFTVTSQPLPSGWLNQDVGQVGVAGSATYSNGTFTVQGSGQYIWYGTDGFHFAYQTLSGDGSIVARVVSVQGGSSSESGVMIRETLTASSDMAYLAYSGSTDIYWIYRPTVGANVSYANTSAVTLPYWVKLVRSGSTFTSYASPDGVNWVQVGGSQTISMAQNVYIGLALSSDVNTSLATAKFDNVSISTPGAPAISALSSTTASAGSAVVISGSGFGATQGNSAVMLNGTAAPITSWSDSSINITIPSGATSGPLAVLVAPSMNASNPVPFTVN